MKQFKTNNERLQRAADKLHGWKELALIIGLAVACAAAAYYLSSM